MRKIVPGNWNPPFSPFHSFQFLTQLTNRKIPRGLTRVWSAPDATQDLLTSSIILWLQSYIRTVCWFWSWRSQKCVGLKVLPLTTRCRIVTSLLWRMWRTHQTSHHLFSPQWWIFWLGNTRGGRGGGARGVWHRFFPKTERQGKNKI